MPIDIKEIRDKEKTKFKEAVITTSDFSIIASNCIGGIIYSDLERKFLSPTINLYLTAKHFLKFVLNLDYYLSLTPRFEIVNNVITGYLEDLEIYCLHYESLEQAESKWNERKTRVINNKIFVVCTDRDGFNNEEYELFKTIKYPKLLITRNKKWKNDPDVLYLEQYSHLKEVEDTIPKREFYKDNILASIINKNF